MINCVVYPMRAFFNKSFALPALFLLCFTPGCGIGPDRVTLEDARVKPLLAAMEEVDRAAMGFTPIAEDANISLEDKGQNYDAMLHVYGKTSRTIAFRKTDSGYRWISEQETHLGPKWEQTVDGTFQESITIEYHTEPVRGNPANQLQIRYSGPRSDLRRPRELTLAQIGPLLQEWKDAPIDPQPPELPGEGFPGDIGFTILGFMFLLACLLVCVLALLLASLAAVMITALVAAGILSASVFTAILRRSVSSGFRALFLQMGAVLGMAMGSFASLIFLLLAKVPLDSVKPWIIGASVGLAAGALLAGLFNVAWGRIVEWIARKLPRRQTIDVLAVVPDE
ncbi:MAG: hypothetical protein L0Y58_00480 [Verrucomicrobia subdivision 3 bacterium]|nr:hypothetical protein [Limisphaerales bacterium]